MNKELNIGDYVRTKKGIIGKIVKEEPFMDTILIFLDNKQGNVTLQNKDGVFKVNHKEDVIKSSPNIINLIQVGDYINGCIVINNKDETIQIIQLIIPFDLKEKDIKSVVTKEQFESMEYKIGE